MTLRATFSLLLFASVAMAQVPTDGLLSFYSFDGDLKSSSSNRLFDLAATGELKFSKGRGGQDRCAVYTYGSGGGITAYASSGNGPSVGGSDFGISFWFRADSSGYSTGSVYQSGCFQQGFPQSPNFMCPDYSRVPSSRIQFDHFVYTQNGDTLYLYKNGELGCKAKKTNTVCVLTQAVTIGKDLGGYLDDMAIYNRTLSQNDIQSLFSAPSSCDIINSLPRDLAQETLHIMPNPSQNGYFQLEWTEPIQSIEAGDMSGQPVELTISGPNTFFISYSGMFLVKVTSGSEVHRLKVMVR